MLIKKLLTGGGDYDRALLQRRWAAIGLLVIRLVGFACFGVALSLFVVLPLSREAYCALFCTLILYTAAFFVSSWWLSKKL